MVFPNSGGGGANTKGVEPYLTKSEICFFSESFQKNVLIVTFFSPVDGSVRHCHILGRNNFDGRDEEQRYRHQRRRQRRLRDEEELLLHNRHRRRRRHPRRILHPFCFLEKASLLQVIP